MPEKLIKPFLRRGLDLNDEEVVAKLAKSFEVSMAALNFRLAIARPRKQLDLF
jgi:Zn-dependent peptidase ImmA (M78 family)